MTGLCQRENAIWINWQRCGFLFTWRAVGRQGAWPVDDNGVQAVAGSRLDAEVRLVDRNTGSWR